MGPDGRSEGTWMNKTFEQVIEEHRIRVGAIRVHVDYDPTTTPEDLETVLLAQEASRLRWKSIPETIRLKSQIARLRDLITQISRLGQRDHKTFMEETEEMREIRSKINRLTDLIPDVDEGVDMEWCRKYMERHNANKS